VYACYAHTACLHGGRRTHLHRAATHRTSCLSHSHLPHTGHRLPGRHYHQLQVLLGALTANVLKLALHQRAYLNLQAAHLCGGIVIAFFKRYNSIADALRGTFANVTLDGVRYRTGTSCASTFHGNTYSNPQCLAPLYRTLRMVLGLRGDTSTCWRMTRYLPSA